MRYFFTSDFHLGHKNIIKYCNRPFKSLEQMNRVIVQKFNGRVQPDDMVFYIGDFCFKSGTGRGEGEPIKAKVYRQQLNCKNIIFTQGNHDKTNSLKTIIQRIVIQLGGKRINLVHNPEFVDINYEINLVGHIHEKWQIQRIRRGYSSTDCINVGVDVWNFYPVTIEDIMRRYSKWLKGGMRNAH